MIGGLTRNRVGQFSHALLEAERKANDAIQNGETFSKAGDWNEAIGAFQEALTYTPDNGLAYQRLAEAQTAIGEMSDAVATYRILLYKWPGKSWSSNFNGDPSVHMQFALVLLRLNQRAEALTVYQRGYRLLQSEEAPTATTPGGGPLPQMLASPDFTASQFEAAVDTVTAIHDYDWTSRDLALTHFQRAIRLQPIHAVPYFYLGQIYKAKTGHAADAVAVFSKAAQLGGPGMKPFIDKALKEGPIEFVTAVKKAALATQP